MIIIMVVLVVLVVKVLSMVVKFGIANSSERGRMVARWNFPSQASGEGAAAEESSKS
jgi:hypothetical protein